jgi:hypothetical protein
MLPPPETITLNKPALTKVINSLLKGGLIAETPAALDDTVWREDGEQRFSLAITSGGLEAIGISDGEQPVPDAELVADKPAPRRGSGKVEAVLALLRRPEGASIADMNAATEWQAHSIRAFLSGLRKQGTEVIRTKDDAGKAIYRINSTASAEQAG